MRLIACLILAVSLSSAVSAATPAGTQRFLHGYRHSWCPYPLPAETSMEEIGKVLDLGFDTVGVSFVGPYNGGRMDFSTLDQALEMIGKRGKRAILHLAPRFLESEGVSDRLDNGRIITNTWDKSPNYSIIDPFNRQQRAMFADWIRQVAKRYGRDKRVAAFVVGWGYMGETGFFIGDFLADYGLQGTECAGYSEYALVEFNRWRAEHKLRRVAELPMPSDTKQPDDYILFQRFRCEFIRNVFHKEIIAAAKEVTDYPVGTFAYIAASPDSYARNWTDTPDADFYRTAGAASSFDMTRTLIDSGVGWEDAWLHDGKWDFSSACLIRDLARQIARGGVHHAMHVRVYDTEPQWEKGVFPKVASFLRTQDLDKRIKRPVPTVALYQPTWGTAAFPARSSKQKFLPKLEYANYTTKMIGLVESFGLPYRLITEWDLMDPSKLNSYQHVIVPMWDLIPRVIGRSRFEKLANDPRVVKVPLNDRPLTRTEFRDILKRSRVKTSLDFGSDRVVAGRYANMVYNWDEKPVQVRVPEQSRGIELQPYEYLLVDTIPKKPVWDPKKVTLVFSIEQAWNGLVAADDQVSVVRMAAALEPLKKRYNVCVILNPMNAKLPGFRHTLDTLVARGMPFVFDAYSSDTLTLGPYNTPADQKHGVSISLAELARFKRDYGPWLVGLRFHEVLAEDFTVRTEKEKHPGWLPATLPLPDDDFFQPTIAEGFIRFAKEHRMFVQWSDWHWQAFASWDEQQKVRESEISGLLRKYPGVVTVTYANNEPNEDSVGRLEVWDTAVRKFVKDGAVGIGLSNQSWLRRDETKTSPDDIIAWSRSAITKGASIVQFEPVWWSFSLPRGPSGGKDYPSDPAWVGRGQPKESFLKLRDALLDMKGKSDKTR